MLSAKALEVRRRCWKEKDKVIFFRLEDMIGQLIIENGKFGKRANYGREGLDLQGFSAALGKYRENQRFC